MTNRRHHDMGGQNAGRVEVDEHDYEMWEKRVDAIIKVLSSPDCNLLSTDELRRGIEELGPGVYDELTYYERWITAATNLLLEKGAFTVEELGCKIAAVQERWLKDREKHEEHQKIQLR